jgi:hypothetical protein
MRGNARRLRAHTCVAIGFYALGACCAWLGLSSAPARATSMRAMSLKEMIARSQKIVRGYVTRIETREDAQHRLWSLYTLEDASAAKGALTDSAVLRFRCLGGELEGRRYRIPGTPQMELGDDVVVFYAPDNAACQVMGWMQGHFRALHAPSGRSNVFNFQDRPVVGVATERLLLGATPRWLPRADADLRVMTRAAAASAGLYDADTGATPDDFMLDLGALARFHRDTAPEDHASEGTDSVIGALPELRPVNPLVSGVAR